MTQPITIPEIVVLNLEAKDKMDAVRQLAERLVSAGRLSEIEPYLAAVAAREEHFPTGFEGGVAIPHAQSDLVSVASVAVGVAPAGVDFGADDGPSNLIFLIAVPASSEGSHLEVLARLARKIMYDEFNDALRAETDPAAIAETVTREVQK